VKTICSYKDILHKTLKNRAFGDYDFFSYSSFYFTDTWSDGGTFHQWETFQETREAFTICCVNRITIIMPNVEVLTLYNPGIVSLRPAWAAY
jgi:hypothetical protein